MICHPRRVDRVLPTLLTVALLFASGSTLLAEQTLFTPSDVARLKYVGGAEISPDGNSIAYTLSVPRDPFKEENGPAYSELHVVDAEGNSRPFVTGKVNVGQVQWTPDGSAIAFTAQRGDDKQPALYLLPIDGGEARRTVTHGSGVSGVAFQPDGDQIAFLATVPDPKEQEEFQAKGFNQEIYEEDWKPTKVWIAKADGSGQSRVLDLDGSASFVSWRPGHQQLVVVMAPTSLVDDSYMFKRVYVVDVDSGKVIQKIENPGKLGQVAWSPDGKRLAMISGIDINDPQEGRLMVVDVPGDGTLKELFPGYQAHVESFAWTGDTTLVWVAAEGTMTIVGQVDVEGNSSRLRGPDLPVINSLSLSKDGSTAALVGETPQHPREVFRMDVSSAGHEPQRLTDSNPWLAHRRMARQEVVTWQAKDGLNLEGILIYPLNYEEGRRYPLIMAVHGGPEAHMSHGWLTGYSYPGQVGAARGFAVFYPNYRGSTGRGVEFSKMGQADAAGKEFDDLIDGVDHLIAIGLVDKDKVGITGGSYGGYASAWGATYYSDRFAASVMFVGISDNVSKVGTTDIPEEMFLVHHLKRLWDDWEYFLERSPIRHVQKHRTPILILHGKNDPRVHPSQSLELFRHLKTLGQAPVRLVFYPGEGHGNRRAAARFDYNLRLMQWMEHYLQGPGGDAPSMTLNYDEHWKSP